MRKTWYVSCSPRNPEKLAPELTQFATLEGKNWNEKRGKESVTQMHFTRLLEDVRTFEGSISKKDPAFSARDRVKPYKTFGFSYVNDEGKIVITAAGRRLVEGKRPKELFLKQLLKWQYPSYQHRGRQYQDTDMRLTDYGLKRARKPRGFYTLPFVDTLSVIRKIGGLSKIEIALFMLPRVRMGDIGPVIRQILRFRTQLARVKGRVARKKFVKTVHYESYAKLYSDETRGARKSEAKALVWKKVRNSLDVADATIRHFRYTGILTVKGSLLSPVESREGDIDSILGMGLKPVDYFDDVDKFYAYVGNPDLPVLPFESQSELIERIRTISTYVERLRLQHTLASSVPVPTVPSRLVPDALSLNQLKDILDSLENAKIEVQRIAQEDNLRQANRSEIVGTFDRIVAGDEDIFDPPVYFEWNTYRALVVIDSASVSPNFVLDEDLQPVSHAPGNKSDVVAEFGDFVLITEVTLLTGKRQYMVEGEPVVDHVGSFRAEELKKSARKVFGLFVAPKIVQNTGNYFLISSKQDYPEYGGPVSVIPMALSQFQDLITFSGQIGSFSPQEIRHLFEELESSQRKASNTSTWLQSIPNVIATWKAGVVSNRHKLPVSNAA